MLPDLVTMRGRQLVWRHASLRADDPLSAWQGLLANRGLSEDDPYFAPRLADLPDPDGMYDMPQAAERVARAVMDSEHIHIFGDFDCDGVCGTAVLLESLRAAGAHVTSSIPHRADDGHGIGVEPVSEARTNGATLGISVDTGTTCFEACRAARSLGFDLIVTDHHLPDSRLPEAFALLNPAREECGFGDRLLCGTGVAFFLLVATWKRLKAVGKSPAFDLRRLLDRVAVATVADVMDLRGVNRILVHHGLLQLNNAPSIGMAALLDVARVKSTVTTETIGFYIAPRINAAGRMRHGEEAMRLLATHDPVEARQLSSLLDESNKERRRVEAEVFRQAEARLNGSDILAVYHDDWHAGVVGLAAGRLARKHNRPAAVGFVTPDERVRVSLRGRPGYHIGNLLNACSEFLEGFGGHAGAGGGTIRPGAWDGFVTAFGKAVEVQGKGGTHPELPLDGILGLDAMHAGLAERLTRFEPLGQGNPACQWLLEAVQIVDRRDMKGGVVRLRLQQTISRHGVVDAVVFRPGPMDEVLTPGHQVSVVGQLKLDDWRGNGAVQFVIEDLLDEPAN
ncbi:MAG TPA: single-stranded-DNA-specific exonuclease RecJ [Mariprofundaceae bacterium]|nr:single-stranded-DNA-specific exonuclease RecJ [Mariprofundaceae bacterium]